VALATDAVSRMTSTVTPLPVFELHEIEAIAAFILQIPDYTPC
jgi:hypothetical protein